jgi:hypothetical protein
MPTRDEIAKETLRAWKDHADIFQYLGPRFIERIKEVPEEYYSLTESELHRVVNPTAIDSVVRHNLWAAIRKSRKTQKPINLWKDVCQEGVACSKAHFFSRMLANPKKVAWLMRPIVDVKRAMQSLEEVMLWRMNEVAMLPFKDQKGNVDHRAVNSFLKAYDIISKHLHGESLNVNHHAIVDHNIENKIKPTDPERMKAVQERIAQLEAARKQDFIDVSVIGEHRPVKAGNS